MKRVLVLFILILLSHGQSVAQAQLRRVDERRAAQVGIRRIDGRHIRLYTDLPAHDAIDGLGNVFDAAVPIWTDYFGVPAERTKRWYVQGFLIQDRAKFSALGLLPEANPKFINGYCQGGEVWINQQASDYYRRHLLLHEGTHAFMYEFLGAEEAPNWYMEGMAELLGTHRWNQGTLALRHFPQNREQAPLWGRIKLVREAQPLSLREVLAFPQRRTLSKDQYAWCWALCKYLDSHPQYGAKFRESASLASQQDFTDQFQQRFQKEWPRLESEWQALLAEIDYGYDTQRMRVQHAQESRPYKEPAEIAAEGGWQSTGWLLKAGQQYEISAAGRFQIARDQEPWPCEPQGVTIEYFNGQPLGKLLGVLWPTEADAKVDFSAPLPIGRRYRLRAETDAILYLRVNDSPAKLSDNRGAVLVSIQQVQGSPSSD